MMRILHGGLSLQPLPAALPPVKGVAIVAVGDFICFGWTSCRAHSEALALMAV